MTAEGPYRAHGSASPHRCNTSMISWRSWIPGICISWIWRYRDDGCHVDPWVMTLDTIIAGVVVSGDPETVYHRNGNSTGTMVHIHDWPRAIQRGYCMVHGRCPISCSCDLPYGTPDVHIQIQDGWILGSRIHDDHLGYQIHDMMIQDVIG